MSRLVEVALPVPVFRTFSYLAPAGDPLAPGTRVVVPFRNRKTVGVVVGSGADAEPGREYKSILTVADHVPALTGPLLETCRWCATHYISPLGIVLRAALPAALGSAAHPTPVLRTHRVVRLTRRLDSLLERDELFRRTRRQREAYEFLEGLPGHVPVDHLIRQIGVSVAVLTAMKRRGLVELSHEAVDRDPLSARVTDPRALHAPTPDQRESIRRITSLTPRSVALLHGVTGSGKTLVYLEVLRQALRREGSGAIVLVPEIALTPQTVDRFRAAFGDDVAVLHSALSDGERLDAWRALRSGRKRIAVGARSAVFAPLERVAAIIVDEEHEASYKQGETPRYNARDLAIVRARHEGAIVVLGSATPSLESWTLAQEGRYALVTLSERAGGGKLPAVEVVDLRKRGGGAVTSDPQESESRIPNPESRIPGPESRIPGPESRIPNPESRIPSHQSRTNPRELTPTSEDRAQPPQQPPGTIDPFRRIFSEPLERALRACLDRAEQSILLLNRRGYAAFMQCSACGDVVVCTDCSVTLTLHRNPDRLACHYCGRLETPSATCQRCGAETIRQRGLGTQQVERFISERFPHARVARMDVDTTSGKWAHIEILDRVASGAVDILLGTQMIAKGLDFPNVTLVGVVDADVGMNLPDFRAAERTFQLLAQVAGRAGRGEKIGRVIVQTRLPDHHAIRCAVTHDFIAFATEELEARATPRYPPVTRLANVVISGPDQPVVESAAQEVVGWLKALLVRRSVMDVHVVGPAPSPIDRIQQRWRWRFLVKSDDSRQLTRVLSYLATRHPLAKSEVRVTIDRDPLSLL
jgi:primosomal protein N' (replication factor Y)